MSKSITLGILCLFMLRLSILSIECCNPTSLPCLMFSCAHLHTSSLDTYGMSWILKKECCKKKHLEFDEGGQEPRAVLWNPTVPFSPSLNWIRIFICCSMFLVLCTSLPRWEFLSSNSTSLYLYYFLSQFISHQNEHRAESWWLFSALFVWSDLSSGSSVPKSNPRPPSLWLSVRSPWNMDFYLPA